MANIVNWYEIPATDFQRAVRFYETVLGVKIHTQEMNGMKVGFMPQEGDAIGSRANPLGVWHSDLLQGRR